MDATLIDRSTRRISWRDRCLSWRDRCLMSARFQRFAADFPVFRWIAQRRAQQLFDLCAGFVYSQVLLACVRLRLLELVRTQPHSDAELTIALGLSQANTLRLLEAGIALRLLQRRDDRRVGLGAQGAALLGNPAVLAMIEHHAMVYADLADPVALLRGQQVDTRLRRYWAYATPATVAELSAEQVADYSRLMAESQALVADDVLDAFDVSPYRALLDVGGGEGGFAISAAQRAAQLQCCVFDLRPVVARARQRIAAAQLESRVTVVAGSFFDDALPNSADLVTLVRVVHDHDDAAVLKLLRAIRATLPKATLLIAEPLADTRGAEAMGAGYFGFYLLAMGSGRPRSVLELTNLLHAAGYARVELRRTRRPLLTQVLIAQDSFRC